MFKLVDEKRGRGIPKGKYHTLKIPFDKENQEEHDTYVDLDETSKKTNIPKHAIAKGVLKNNRRLIRDFHR